MKKSLLAAPLALLFACDSPTEPEAEQAPQTVEQEVVYGADDRMDWHEHPDETLRTLTSNAIVALIRDSGLDTSDPEDVLITAGPLGPSRGLCEDERFYNQPRSASCSGTLIDADLVLTAGHCVDNDDDCRGFSFVFDYYYEEDGVLKTINAEEDVYECDSVVARELGGGMDYAIIRLDRQVHASHAPALVRFGAEPMADNEPVTIIGFGSGLPAKIDNGGFVTNPRSAEMIYFNATTDAFGGNSGSGVFNEANEVVGILVRGATDYVTDGGCQRVNVLAADPGDAGEDITYASNAIEALCASGYESPLCGGPGGWCRTCEVAEDCEEGWLCGPSDDGTGLSWCAPTCESDEECRADHECTDDGYCTPLLLDRCYENDVWFFNTCGRRLDVTEDCGRSQFCVSAECVDAGAGNSCAAATTIDAESQTITGVLDDTYSDGYVGSCGGDGVDRVLRFRLDEERRVVATVRGFDTVLYLRQTCEGADTEFVCNDNNDPPGNGGSRVDEVLGEGTHYLFVDAFGLDAGEYELQLQFLPICECDEGEQRCGGGAIETCSDVDAECPDWVADECGDGLTCIGLECAEQSAGDTCADARTIEPSEGIYSGDLSVGYGNDTEGSCGGVGPEELYVFTLTEAGEIWAQTTGSDTVLHLREACDNPETEYACNDDDDQSDEIAPGSTIGAILPAGTFYLAVDAYDWDTAGEYELSVRFGNACVDQCPEEDDFDCQGPLAYRACGQFDEDSCLDLSPEMLCEGDLRCSDLHSACIDPENPPDLPDPDFDVGTSDGGVDSGSDAGDDDASAGGDLSTDGGGSASGGSGGGGGCAAARGSVTWFALLGLLALRRRRE